MKRQPLDLIDLHREQLVDIGRILRETRESRNLNHDEIAEKTLIRSTLLKAIEAADVQQLPEPVYTRGLIRQYANFLDLDGDTLSSQYFTPPQVKPKSSFWRVAITPQLRPVHLYITYILVIGAAVSGLSYTLKQAGYGTSTLPPLTGEDLEAAMEPPASLQPTQETGVSDNSLTVATDSPVRVAVEIQNQSWLRITVDGEVSFEGVLREGDSRVWTADERLIIRAGNAGGVMVSFNEGASQSLGKPGVVTEVAFPPTEATAFLP